MSLRYVSRFCVSAGARVLQSVKEQGPKVDGGLKSLQPAAKKDGGMRNQVRRFSGAADSAKRVSLEEKRRREAEKAEKVYNLICWGPN
ncbi:hypothetical protein EJ110_NYTH29740 [Nymphaea thermarum]|nr:hypothetical protein EJ110_NYTH29740 [Nymphaea thermarum]